MPIFAKRCAVLLSNGAGSPHMPKPTQNRPRSCARVCLLLAADETGGDFQGA